MNNKIKDKRKNILNKVKTIINDLDYKKLEYFEDYFEKNFNVNFNKYIDKNEEKNQIRIEMNTLCDDYMIIYCDNYYYNQTSNIFFYYDKLQYTYINVDNLMCNILLNIQSDYPLLSSQSKILLKKLIIKKIKTNNYTEIIPESITIQNTLNYLSPIIFENKIYSKYFLTFIGDLILKKNKNEKCFILNTNEYFKCFMIKLNKYISYLFHSINIFNNIKFKFFNHSTENANILYLKNKLNETYFNKDLNFIISFLFICIYHSKKYENSNMFLKEINNTNEYGYITQLKDINIDMLVDKFWNDTIICKSNCKLNEDSIMFLWKDYLKKNKLPKYLLFQQNFINLFSNIYKNKINKEIENNNYNEITSFNIPQINEFLDFWNNNIIKDQNEKFLELEEIELFFKKYLRQNNKINYNKYFNNNLIDIILHFFSDLKYEDNKYFHGLKIKGWDKLEDIRKFKENYKGKKKINSTLYNNYCKYKKSNKESDTIVSKIYFINFCNF